MNPFTEATLVQQTTAAFLADELGWESVLAYHHEDFGPDGLLGRASDREVVLTRRLRAALARLNPGLPASAYDDALRHLTDAGVGQSLTAINRDKYALIRDGVKVTWNEGSERRQERLRVIDFDNPYNNDFLCVRELWVRGDLYRRRADIVGFVNGLPLLFMELKNLHRSVRAAYDENFLDYLDTVPHLFHHNAFIVVANGDEARIGSHTSRYEHFHEWKRLAEEEEGVVAMETLLRGVCTKRNFLDLLENFILFDDSRGETRKIIARNHQFLGVNRAVDAVRDRKALEGKLGVFWHTQGAGKSYSMVFFTRKVHRRLGSNFTFLLLTDRTDLDEQLYKTFAGCGVVDHDRDPCRAIGGSHLKQLLAQHKQYLFTLIQKFNLEVEPDQPYTARNDIIVISDEAHRTQYGDLALNMRNALPNASFIGFTGTPLFKEDEITRRVFGGYLSTYDFQRAVEDQATVPLYYDARGEKLGLAVADLNEQIAAQLEALEEGEVENLEGQIDLRQRLESELSRDYHILTADKRLEQVAQDFVQHVTTRWEAGKVMLVCIDKITCVKMFDCIEQAWQAYIADVETARATIPDDSEAAQALDDQLTWLRETQMAVVLSEAQGEVARFRNWGLDIRPHRRLLKEGIELPEPLRRDPRFGGRQRLSVEEAFKEEGHPLRIAIVCAMWLTGFDVPSLATLYLDKPLKAHTLMQAIARANRVHAGKPNGLIVDYCGILSHLRQALATFVGVGDGARGTEAREVIPARPDTELLDELAEAVALVQEFLAARGVALDEVSALVGFARNRTLVGIKEAINEDDESRKRFELICRDLFRKFKTCLTVEGINNYRKLHSLLSLVYRSLQIDRERADISAIIRELHGVLDEAVTVQDGVVVESSGPYDISGIDFERLRQEFAKSPTPRTTVQNLKSAIEQRLNCLLARNPLRMDFQRRYQAIIELYNRQKEGLVIQQTFEALLSLVQEMDEEEQRATREGLDEETLAIFDLLKKPTLSKTEVRRIKQVAVALLETLKRGTLAVNRWQEKEATRDAVRLAIHDFLYDDQSGLPGPTYTSADVEARTDELFLHVVRVYPRLPSPYYDAPLAA